MNRITILRGPHARWTRTVTDVLFTEKTLLGCGFEVDSACWNCRMKHQTSVKGDKEVKGNKTVKRAFNSKISRRPGQRLMPTLPKAKTLSDVIQPVQVSLSDSISPNDETDSPDIGEEIAGQLDKDKLQELLKLVTESPEILELIQEELKLSESMITNVVESFSRYCQESSSLPVSLHVRLSDILNGGGTETDLVPFLIEHGQRVYPHTNVIDDLEKLCIANMTDPFNWFPQAREMKRKIVYHSGPTNSGKTFTALQSFLKAETGVYLAPLRLLAIECCSSTNSKDVPCDLLTGERTYFVHGEQNPANHRSSTIEMLDRDANYDVAVIDEIQMIADKSRGGHWTNALLGVKAKEVHVCGDSSVINLVKSFAEQCGDSFKLKVYHRKNALHIQDKALGSIENVKPGDCIVCFQVKHLFDVTKQLRENGLHCALIYGALPPGMKIHQAEIFNDQNNSCNILVATDAVGMGLNLAIKRIIFYGIEKIGLLEQREELIDKFSSQKIQLSSSQVKQIAGRAGRYGGVYSVGEVTAFHESDMEPLKDLLNEKIPDIKMVYVALCKTGRQFFLCNAGVVIQNAMLLDHIKLPLIEKLTFCLAPVRNTLSVKSIAVYMKMASLVSKGCTMDLDWFLRVSEFSSFDLKELKSFEHALEIFHLTDVYLWLSYKFDKFQDVERMRNFRIELDRALREYIEKTYSNFDPKELESLLMHENMEQGDLRSMDEVEQFVYEQDLHNGDETNLKHFGEKDLQHMGEKLQQLVGEKELQLFKETEQFIGEKVQQLMGEKEQLMGKKDLRAINKKVQLKGKKKQIIDETELLEMGEKDKLMGEKDKLMGENEMIPMGEKEQQIKGEKEQLMVEKEILGETTLELKESPTKKKSDILKGSSRLKTKPRAETEREVEDFRMEDSDKLLGQLWYEAINYEPEEMKKISLKENNIDGTKTAKVYSYTPKQLIFRMLPESPRRQVEKKPNDPSAETFDRAFAGQKMKGFLSFLQEKKLNIKDGAAVWRTMSDEEHKVYMKGDS